MSLGIKVGTIAIFPKATKSGDLCTGHYVASCFGTPLTVSSYIVRKGFSVVFIEQQF